MTADDIRKLAFDLKQYARLEPMIKIAEPPRTLHILTINGVDFYFYASKEKQYDGWGSGSPELLKRLESGDLNIEHRDGSTEYGIGQ